MTRYPIVILHGWRLSKETYKELMKLFKKKGYSVFALDLPGFGREKKMEKVFRLKDYVSFFYKYLRKKRLEKIILIGHSFGGRLAIKFTSEYPQLVKKLILTGTPGFSPVRKEKIIFFLILSKIGKAIFSFYPFSLLQNPARRFLYRLARATDYVNTEGNLKDTFKSIINEDLVNPMNLLNLPTILVWGEDDSIVPLKVAEKMHKIIKKSRLIVVSNASHKLPYQQPVEFIQAIEDYLK